MNKRLGLIIPSSNTTMEREFYNLLYSSNFSIHVSRVRLKEVNIEGLSKMENEVESESIKLADAGVDIIGYGCTSGSLLKGIGYDEFIKEKIENSSGVPAVVTATAVINALKSFQVKKVSLFTPYISEINDLEKKFFLDHGFKVIDVKALGISSNLEIGKLIPNQAFELVINSNLEETEAIFISCTNFPTLEVIEKLERKLKKPVISSNIATFWAMIKRVNNGKVNIKRYGRLLKEKLNLPI